ncbi:diguanylate cyclase [Desulfobotulus sp. H1]|uniref:Diguanylate cyclase n=1 Tax=Desulfobotulus pelophilus TaxID=2823377 RepID=A0ABT3N7N0_9BACT|nr:diguanylate cyclase [Desulfobotulus pelophilus]MCW7753457.1 diguanylate cyclase [Desulfobotulus pelophilus]
MYHRLLKIFILTDDPLLAALLQDVSPREQFSHQFLCQPHENGVNWKSCSVIILDSPVCGSALIQKIHEEKADATPLIASFTTDRLPLLAEVHDLLDQIWIRPFAGKKVQTSFANILQGIKKHEDASLTERYLDTLMDSLPDLIWFKDARGAHLKVNNSFCHAVEKTKEQIQGRGHYYIWGIEPDEYAQGEYICLESEEIVLNKKETCLFDETVKCHDELRKFKTYKSPVFDSEGEVIGTVGFAHDVTDLQNLMIELNILLECLPFAVMVTDKEKNITLVNQKFSDIFLLKLGELTGRNIDSFIDETQNCTRSKRWIIEREEEVTLLLSKNRVLKIHDEKLLDIFGVLAGYIYLFLDISLEYSYKNKLLMDANTDHLTQLNNRRSLQDFMRKTPCQHNTALLLADLDNFKEVNDQFGHDEGDRILVAFSTLLQEIFPAKSLFRLGGDEFAIILPEVEDHGIPRQYAEKLLAGFDTTILRDFAHTRVSVSIGIAIDVDDSENFGELFKRADIALYDAKNSGKSAYKFWKKPARLP